MFYKEVITEIQDLITYPLKYPQIFSTIGVKPPKGILICGPAGSGTYNRWPELIIFLIGKTMLGLAICNEMGLGYHKLTGTEIISSMSGESEVLILWNESLNVIIILFSE